MKKSKILFVVFLGLLLGFGLVLASCGGGGCGGDCSKAETIHKLCPEQNCNYALSEKKCNC